MPLVIEMHRKLQVENLIKEIHASLDVSVSGHRDGEWAFENHESCNFRQLI